MPDMPEVRDLKVAADVIHQQDRLSLSLCVRKAGRAHVGPGFQPAAGF